MGSKVDRNPLASGDEENCTVEYEKCRICYCHKSIRKTSADVSISYVTRAYSVTTPNFSHKQHLQDNHMNRKNFNHNHVTSETVLNHYKSIPV